MTEIISRVSTFFVLLPSVVAAILAVSSGLPKKGQNPQFTQALDNFQQNDFADAKQKFQELVSDPAWQFAANYNLGHVAMRQGRPGEALASYRKAQTINPLDRDTRHNVEFIRNSLGLRQLNQSRGTWDLAHEYLFIRIPGGFFLAAILLTSSLVLFFLRKRLLMKEELSQSGALILAGVLFAASSFLGVGKLIDSSIERGTIIEPKVGLKSGPSAEHATLIDVSEGLEVEVNSRGDDDWVQVSFSGGMTGWIPSASLIITSGATEE